MLVNNNNPTKTNNINNKINNFEDLPCKDVDVDNADCKSLYSITQKNKIK